jgi:cytochrome c5
VTCLRALVLAFASIAASAGAGADEAKTPRSAEAILDQYCNVCHLTGWNGAPLSGAASDWQPRLITGFDSLFKNAKQGINNMPPMGTCMDCSDAELEAAIRKMLP